MFIMLKNFPQSYNIRLIVWIGFSIVGDAMEAAWIIISKLQLNFDSLSLITSNFLYLLP